MRKRRVYFQKDLTYNIMYEMLVDKSLHIYLLNEYKKDKSPWTISSTQSFMSEEELKTSFESKVKTLKQMRYSRTGNLSIDFSVIKLKYFSYDIRWLVKEYAEELLMIEAAKKNPKPFEFREKTKYKEFLLSKLNLLIQSGRVHPNFNIEAQAKRFIKSTGYVLELKDNGVISFYQTKRKQAEDDKLEDLLN